MPRVKRGVTAHKKREKLLTYVKGFRWGRKSKERSAKEALLHAWSHAFVGRKLRKRNFRRLHQVQVGAAARTEGISYSKFMGALKKKNIALDRKILSEIAQKYPMVFSRITETAKA